MIHRYDARFLLAMRWAERAVLVSALAIAVVYSCASDAQIPPDANKYKRDLIRNARLEWGLDAPTSTFASQIAAESNWVPTAVSRVGASGLAQFMPATGKWLSGLYTTLGPHEPFNPAWAIRALVTYDKFLYERVAALTHCERMAKTLASYNGGLANLQAEERVAATKGLDTSLWFGGVEKADAGRRSAANFAENRNYPKVILRILEPRYRAAGWGIHSCGQ